MAEKQWKGTTWGNGWMHKWLIRILHYVDVRVVYAFVSVFVIPICLVCNPSRHTAYVYFRERVGYGRCKAVWKTYVNHCLFGQVVVDRFAMYAGRRFDVEVEGLEHYTALTAQPEGFVLLSAHVGNYEIAGYTLEAEAKVFNVLVFADEKSSVMQNRDRLFSAHHIRMIGIRPDMSHLFEINNALVRGETVSMPADRFNGSTKSLTLPFLGAAARFPLGPFSVATMRGVDVLAIHVLKTSWKTYKIFISPLPYDKNAPRPQQTRALAEAFVADLTARLRAYPEQWYNYYDFWLV